MASDDTEDKRRKAAETEAEAEAVDDNVGSPDDVIAGPDAPADPQIRTMSAAPPPAAGPAGPGMPAAEHAQGHGWGHGGFGGGWLQQLMQRIQQAQQQRQQMQQQHMQQFAGTPMGQQFMQGPMGQQMQQHHPDWFPAAPAAPGAPGGQPPANIMAGDHTGMPGPGALPPTAAEQAHAQAQAPQAPAAAPAQPAQTARAPSRDRAPQPAQQAPAMAQPQQQTRMPMFGNGANDAIAQALRARNGGGGRRMF